MGMTIYLDGFTQEEVDRLNIERTYAMLGIDPEAEAKKEAEEKAKAEEAEKAAKADRLRRFTAAVHRLNRIRSGEEKSDIRKGAKIKIDEFVFVV